MRDDITWFTDVSDIPSKDCTCLYAYQLYESIKDLTEVEKRRFVMQNNIVYYDGFRFSENTVNYINIYNFSRYDLYNPEYIDITRTFNDFKDKISVYKICELIRNILYNYPKDSLYVENIIPIIKNYDKYLKPKFKYQLQKHRNKQGRFVTSSISRNNRIWNNLLHRAITEICDPERTSRHNKKRSNSMHAISFKRRKRSII